jgi:hypothetical protein
MLKDIVMDCRMLCDGWRRLMYAAVLRCSMLCAMVGGGGSCGPPPEELMS